MRPRRSAAAARVLATVVLLLPFCCTGLRPAGAEEQAPSVHAEPQWDAKTSELARLFDAVVETIEKKFFDETLLKQLDWRGRANAVRPSVLSAERTEDAARRINALLSELKTSHTALYTPDDYQYYILLDVLRGDWETDRSRVQAVLGKRTVLSRNWSVHPTGRGSSFRRRHSGRLARRPGRVEVRGRDPQPSMACPTARSRPSAARSARRSSLKSAAARMRRRGACKFPSTRYGRPRRLRRRPRPARASSSGRTGGSATCTSGRRTSPPPSRARWPSSSRRASFSDRLRAERRVGHSQYVEWHRPADPEAARLPHRGYARARRRQHRGGGTISRSAGRQRDLLGANWQQPSPAPASASPGNPKNPPFRGRSALLIDHHTRSAAEFMAAWLQAQRVRSSDRNADRRSRLIGRLVRHAG